MKRILLVLFCCVFFPVLGSHIVGGEFEIIHISGFNYRINMIVYFDEVNGAQSIKQADQIIVARIFRVSDDKPMLDVALFLEPSIPNVPYTQPECSIGKLRTSKMMYTREIKLPAEDFDDPEGYYIVWERCCRNYTITNIHSANPQGSAPGIAAGQTFYLKFPPVVKDGVPFVNSSPELFPPLSDYACMSQPYYANFAGTDRDGDSLVYSLVTPLSTHSAGAYPPILAQPYPEVEWRPGFSIDGIMGGSPDLAISADGLLTVTPAPMEGLFVFEVLCEEFRDGVKIGEVRRDFQMLVVECDQSSPPAIKGIVNGQLVNGTMNVTFSYDVPDDERCVTVRVDDPDAFLGKTSESVGIRAIPLGFNEDVSEILVGALNAELSSDNPYVEFPICFEKCPYKRGGFRVGIIAYDDACSLPLLDTLVINVTIQPPPNSPAALSGDLSVVLHDDETVTFDITGVDADNDELVYEVVPIDFTMEDIGIVYREILLQQGSYQGELTWDVDCDEDDYNIGRNFQVQVRLDDLDECNFNPADTAMFSFTFQPPSNAKPFIVTSLSDVQVQNGLVAGVLDPIKFDVGGVDLDHDMLTLEMLPGGFNANALDISFNDTTNISNVKSQFLWPLECGKINLAVRSDYLFYFLLTERTTKCKLYDTDTLAVNIHLVPPTNSAPLLTMASINQPMENNRVTATPGEQISIQLNSTDSDIGPADLLRIELIEADGEVPPAGFEFTTVPGQGSAHGTLAWAPDCSIFQNGIYENEYTFAFRAYDDRCQNAKADTVMLDITIKDIDGSGVAFVPPNIVTPNGDGCNDFFALEGFEYEAPPSQECAAFTLPNLPPDNCMGRFRSIRIYNRWGKLVYESTQRNFRWYASDEAAGVYFYTLLYTNPDSEKVTQEYKGSISVRY